MQACRCVCPATFRRICDPPTCCCTSRGRRAWVRRCCCHVAGSPRRRKLGGRNPGSCPQRANRPARGEHDRIRVRSARTPSRRRGTKDENGTGIEARGPGAIHAREDGRRNDAGVRPRPPERFLRHGPARRIRFVLGLATGSFVNVCIRRWPIGMVRHLPGSHCPDCGILIARRDKIPVLRFFLLGRRCRYCSRPISWRYPSVELLNGAVWAALAARDGGGPEFWKHAIFASMMIVLLFTDLDRRILPIPSRWAASDWESR